MTLDRVEIDASGIYYSDLNQRVREAVERGARKIVLKNVFGQRYIGTNLYGALDSDGLVGVEIEVHGTPGNDLGAFLDGPAITVYGSVMDGTGNTMNRGRIAINGRAGDITGFSARGGEIFVRDSAGYRVAIHMKEYGDKRPVIVIGGTTQDFLGEYMAGGVVIVLGLNLSGEEPHYCSHVGTGMHGGAIFIRGRIMPHQIGSGVGESEITAADESLLEHYLSEYGRIFGINIPDITPDSFIKLTPISKRPYKQLYAY